MGLTTSDRVPLGKFHFKLVYPMKEGVEPGQNFNW